MRALLVSSDAYDAVIAGLVLHFVPDPRPAIREMVRATRRGGAVAAHVWASAGERQFTRYFWQAATALDTLGRYRYFVDRTQEES